MNLLSRLESTALLATQGEWTIDDDHPRDHLSIAYRDERGGRGHVVSAVEFKSEQGRRDIEYIALACPENVLKVIARVRELEDMLRVTQEQNDALGDANELAVALEEALAIADRWVGNDGPSEFEYKPDKVRLTALRSLLSRGPHD